MADMESKPSGSGSSQDIPDNAQDLTIFVQNLLEQMVIHVFVCSYFVINLLCLSLATTI
jgi:hypothetical protein